MNRVEILGVPIDNVTQQEAIERMREMIRSGKPHLVITPALLQIMTARRDPEYDRILQCGDLTVADGMLVVFASWLHKTPLKERVTGVDLVPEMCRMAAENGFSVFFFGGEEGVAQETANQMQQRFPSLTIAGAYSPPYLFENDPAEENKAIQMIRDAQPDILFIAMSCPRQDKWLYKNKEKLAVPVQIGVGAAFNFITGHEKRAPQWMQNIGMEAVYRFFQRPKEIWRRVAINAPYFFVLLFDLFTYRTQKTLARLLRPILLGVVDALLAPLMFLFSYWLYFRSGLFSNTADPFPLIKSLLDMPAYSDLFVFVSILGVGSLWFHRLYRREKYASTKEIVTKVGLASITAIIALIAFQFIFKDLFYVDRFPGYSRMVFGFYMIGFFVAILLWRMFFVKMEHFLHTIGINLDRIIVVGKNQAGISIVQTMLDRPELGNFPLGYVVYEESESANNSAIPILGTIDDLKRLLPARKVDEVLIADPEIPKEYLYTIVKLCQQQKITLSIVPSIHELMGVSSEIKQVGGIRVISVSLDPDKRSILQEDSVIES